MNRQSDDQRGSNLAEMSRGISVEMTGRASRANVMNMHHADVPAAHRLRSLPLLAMSESFSGSRRARLDEN